MKFLLFTLIFFTFLPGCAPSHRTYNDYSMVDWYKKYAPLRNVTYYKDDKSNNVVISEIHSNKENVLKYIREFNVLNEGFCSKYRGAWYYGDNSSHDFNSENVDIYTQEKIAFRYRSKFKCQDRNGNLIYYGNGFYSKQVAVFNNNIVYTLKFHSVVPLRSPAFNNVDYIGYETPYPIKFNY